MNRLTDEALLSGIEAYMKKKRQELPLTIHNKKKGFSTFSPHGIPSPHITILLRTPGCSWLRESGGCTMCGFVIDSLYPDPCITADDIITQFTGEIGSYDHLGEPLTVSLFNNGSFFNSREIPVEAQYHILQSLAEDERVREVRIETRPEYVSHIFLQKILPLYKKTCTELHVAIGLEISNDLLRALTIHKGFTFSQVQRAGRVLIPPAYLDIYLLLKPPFLTEKEALEEIIHSLATCSALLPSTVFITPCKIFPTTILMDLAHHGYYRVPWLWSLLECALIFSRGMFPFRLFLVSGVPVDEEPVRGVVGAKNCGKCDQTVVDTLDYFNRYQSVPDDLPGCSCRREWEALLLRDAPPIRERIMNFLQVVGS
ncbi:MAG: hypothetical protein HXS47_12745 [Theionarchaea archaeon]|nr:hypothetical protein [Theionarchaea archaeon]